MTAQTLRDAAKVLRDLIGTPSEESEDFIIPGPWSVSGHYPKFEVVPQLDESYDTIARTEYEVEAAYIATMHPGVGLALADWLDDAAERRYHTPTPPDYALAVARAILGGDA